MKRRGRILSGIVEMTTLFFQKRVPRASSALAYSLVFTLFPFLVCLNGMVASLNLTQARIIEICAEFMPIGAIETISSYVDYISETSAATPMFLTGLIGTFTSAAACFRSVLNTMDDINGTVKPRSFFKVMFSFVLSIAFLLVIYASCIVIVCGNWLVNFVTAKIKIPNVISLAISWKQIRFVLLFIMMFFIIYAIYYISAPRVKPRIPRARGALFATVLLEGLSIAFSHIISLSTRYALIYGSLASIVVLLSWLYLSGIILYLGNILNVVIYRHKIKKIS